MSNITYHPNAGRMPALDALPLAMHQPIGLLSKMECVQGVVSGIDPFHNQMVILVTFTDGFVAQFRQALECFQGFRPQYIDLNKQEHYLHLIVGHEVFA